MQIDYETVQRWVQEKRNQDGYGVLPVDLYFYVAQRAADHVSTAKSADIPNQPGLNIDLTRMREAALHAQVHGVVFKASGSQVRQVLDHLHERVLEINRLNARIAELEAQPEFKPLTDGDIVAAQEKLIAAKDDLYRSRIGQQCSRCSAGK